MKHLICMKHYLPGVCLLIGVTILGSCSNNDEPARPGDSKAIDFSVTVPRSSRAATTTESIDEFSVWAFVEGKTFMDNVAVNRVNNKWSYSPTMYWPADNQSVNFYSVSPQIPKSEATVSNGADTPDITGYTNTDGTTDLLYAVNMDETAGATNIVRVNFRHALSQLQFNVRRRPADDPSAALRVDVKALELLNIYSKGDLTMPRQTTGISGENLSRWSAQSEFSNPVIYNGDIVTLDTDDAQTLNSTGYYFSMPQTLAESVSTPTEATSAKGAYIRVLCAVYDQKSGVKLWPSQSTSGYTEGMAYLYFPLSTADSTNKVWQPGYAYRYNITIGVPAGSSVIDFDVTVDDYKEFTDLSM